MKLEVVAGDWKTGPGDAMFSRGGLAFLSLFQKKPRFFSLGIEKIPAEAVASLEIVTQENKDSLLAKAAWGVAGAAVLGVAGALAGAIAKGKQSMLVLMLTLKDGRRAVLRVKVDDAYKLLMAVKGADEPSKA